MSSLQKNCLGLFNDIVSTVDWQLAWRLQKGEMCKDWTESGRGQFENTITAFTLGDWKKQQTNQSVIVSDFHTLVRKEKVFNYETEMLLIYRNHRWQYCSSREGRTLRHFYVFPFQEGYTSLRKNIYILNLIIRVFSMKGPRTTALRLFVPQWWWRWAVFFFTKIYN
jgi:hypothetical protein